MFNQKLTLLLLLIAAVFVLDPTVAKSERQNTAIDLLVGQRLAQTTDEASEAEGTLSQQTEFQQAEAAYRTGDYDTAIAHWKSAIAQHQQAGDTTGVAVALNKLGLVYRILAQYDDAIAAFTQSLSAARDSNSAEAEATALDSLGTVYLLQGDYLEALPLFEESLAINENIDNNIGRADNIDHIGSVYLSQQNPDQQDLPKALSFYKQSLEISQAENYTVGEARAAVNLGIVYFVLKDYEQAIAFYEQGAKLKEEVGDHSGALQALNSLGASYAFTKRYDEALEAYQQSLFLSREMGDLASEANLLGIIGFVQQSSERYEEALLSYQQSLAIERELQDTADEALMLSAITELRMQIGRYDEAVDAYQQQLTSQRNLGDRKGESDTLVDIGLVYEAAEDHSESIRYYLSSLAIKREIEDREGQALVLRNIGVSHSFLEDYDKAISYFQQSLSVEKALEDRADQALLLRDLGRVYLNLKEYEIALNYFQESLILEKELSNTERESLLLSDIGITYYNFEDYETAIDYYQQSLEIAQADDELSAQATRLRSIGLAYQKLRDYDSAIDYYQKSLAIERDLGDRKREALLLGDLFRIYDDTGRHSQALDYAQQSLAVERQVGDKKNIAIALNDVGIAYNSLEETEQSIAHFEESLVLRRELKNFDGEALALRNIGSVYARIKDDESALDYYQQSLALRKATGSVESQVFMLSVIGRFHRDRGNDQQALSFYQKVAEIGSQDEKNDNLYFVRKVLENVDEGYSSGKYDIQTVLSLYETGVDILDVENLENVRFDNDLKKDVDTLMTLYWKQEKFDQAIDVLNSISIANESGSISMLSSFAEVEPLLALSFAVNSDYINNAAVTAHVNQLSTTDTTAELSLLGILRRKGRSLEGRAVRSRQRRQEIIVNGLEKLAEINEINTLLANLHFENINRLSSEERDVEVQSLESRLRGLSSFQDYVNEGSDEAESPYNNIKSIDEIQSLIPENAALVEFFVYRPFDVKDMGEITFGDKRYVAYVFTQAGKIEAVDLGSMAEIDQQVAIYRQALRVRSPQVNAIARELDEMLMAPVRPLLGDKTHLIISPDGQLNVMPFDALVDEAGQYLIESYQTSYLTSGRDLRTLGDSEPSRQPPVIVANPDYASTDDRSAIAEVPEANSDINPRAADMETLTFGPLPGTAQEANAIAPLLPNVAVFTQTQATEALLKQLEAPSILHIATHGFFLPDVSFEQKDAVQNNSRGGLGASFSVVDTEAVAALIPENIDDPLLRSGLVLAGINSRKSGGSDRILEDGVFTALEASGINLQGTQLVVLSACETGLGAASNGDGVFGLRRAFAIAGAESQLMSLWQVDDTGTSELMHLYYENLIVRKQGRSEALRNAQLALLNTGTYQHPYYWSSFIFSGDWRPIENMI